MRIDIEEWDQLIGSAYESILRPADLRHVLTTANTMLESDLCHLFGVSQSGAETFRIISDHDYESTVDAYAHHYGHIDPRRSHLDAAPLGGIYRCSEICDSSFVNRSEFYQDYYLPHGLRYVLGSCLLRDQHQSVYISFNHKLGREDFTDVEKKHFELFIGHIKRVIRSSLATSPISDALKAGEDYLHRYQHGILGLTQAGRVSFANKMAEDMLSLLPNQFMNSRLTDGSQLQQVFLAVGLSGKPESCLIKHSGGNIYITALPFRSQAHADGQQNLHIGTDTKVLMLCGGQHRGSHSARQLMQWFSFTAAEARLARDLANGGNVDDFAKTYSVSIATVRTQLRAVLQKSGTTRQQDLVRLLSTLPLSS